MPDSQYPYLNRGAYKWVPDDYALTSGSALGFTSAYYPAQVDYGLPVNTMPKGTPGSGYAREVRVFGKGLYDNDGKQLDLDDGFSKAEGSGHNAEVMSAPFLKTLMRGLDSHLEELPFPEETDGIHIYYDGNSDDPPWLFIGAENRRMAGFLLRYVLSMDTHALGGENTTPLSLVAVYDKNAVGSLWLTTARGDATSQWGPPTRTYQAADGYDGILSDVAGQLGLSSGNLAASYVPMYYFDAKSPLKMLSFQELQISNSSGALDAGSSLQKLFRLSGDSWSIVDYFPNLVGFIVGPNMIPMKDGSKPWKKGPWKAIVQRVREYDAVKANGMPARGEEPAQFPCKIFGYALRMNQKVEMSKYTSPLQPSIGTTLSKDPGNGLGTRQSTFWFKLFHPDSEYSHVGFAHGLRFYYLIAALPLPGTSPLFGAASLVGVLAALEADQDLIMVQFVRVLAGEQTLNFSFGGSQSGSDLGRVAYAGAYDGYSRTTKALVAFKSEGRGTPSLSWTKLGHSDLPTTDPNGLRPMWYDSEGTPATYYAFTEASLGNPFTPALLGFPRTDLGDRGAFSMSTSTLVSFSGGDRTQVYAKPRLIGISKPEGYCSSSNAKAHLATFISDVRTLGGSALLYTGDWKVQFDAFVDDVTRLNSQVFFRFAIIDGGEYDASNNAGKNGYSLWSMNSRKIQEFHFENAGGKWYIASGPPTDWESTLISTLTLGTANRSYATSWFLEGAKLGDSVFSQRTPSGASGDVALLETRISMKLGEISNPRIVVQAWAVASPRSGVPSSVTPESDKLYPAVSLAWGGDTGSSLQTTFVETKADTLYPQQDPYVMQSGSKKYDRVVALDKGDGPQQSDGAPFRDVPKYGNVLDFSSTASEPPVLGRILLSTETKPEKSNISMARFTPDSFYEPSLDYAHVADMLLTDGDGGKIAIAGASIKIGSAKMSFDYETNRSTFDAVMEFELEAVYLDGRSAYTIAKSPRIKIVTSGTDATSPATGQMQSIAFEAGPIEGIVPQEDLYLGLRVRMWPYNNSRAKVPISGTDGASWNAAFCSIDLANFLIEGLDIEILNDYRYLSGKGGQDFYQGLDVATARTFGASDYTFVPDAEVLKTQIIVPRAATSSQFGYWYFTGTLFSPFYMFDDEMPEGAAFATRGGTVLLSGNEGVQTLPDGIWIRTAVDEVPSRGLSSDREATPFGAAGHLARPRPATESTGNFMSIMSLAAADVDGTRMESIVRRGGDVVVGKNPLIVTLNREHGVPSGSRRFRTNANAQTKLLLYEDSDLSDRAGSPVIAMMINRDGSCMNWQNPPADGEGGTGVVVVDEYMSMLSAAVSPIDFSLHLAGFKPLDPGNPTRGGAVVMKTLSPGLVFGIETSTLSPYHYVDGLVDADAKSENYAWNTGSGPLLPAASETLATNSGKLAVAESFPDVVVDHSDYVHVFYPLLATEADTSPLGKIFCRTSTNEGYRFSDPIPVMDLGFSAAKSSGVGVSANDQSFAVSHPVVVYDGENGMFIMFAWAGGKIFMKSFSHPQAASYAGHNTGIIDLVAGDTSFAIRSPGTGLEAWLRYNWDLGQPQSDDVLLGSEDSYAKSYYASDSSKSNNYAPSSGTKGVADGTMPWVRIVRYYNEVDVPAQRIGVFMDANQEISLFYNDALDNLVYRRVRIKGATPHISPPLILSTTTL